MVGNGGSGKTTLINIFMGILTPNKGNILIDDVELFNQNIKDIKRKWKKSNDLSVNYIICSLKN